MIEQVLKHYRILEQIGAGGMGVVYRAHDEELDRDVAIKVLPAGTFADDSASRRFRKEALSLARLNHPNVATVHEFSSDNGIDFLVTEYIPGLSLDSKIAGRPLPAQKIMNLGIQLAHGLAAAHDQNIVHRDLKPANLRVTPDGRLKILDFGLAQLANPNRDQAIYGLAFLGADGPAMAGEEQWFAGRPQYENVGLALASDTYYGRFAQGAEIDQLGCAVRHARGPTAMKMGRLTDKTR